jgi:hypothetical protein
MSVWFIPKQATPQLEPALARLAEIEAAARRALDHAEVAGVSGVEYEQLFAAWGEANDRLADAIVARDKA